jgi:enoyl-CoA hydratase/carnithine racemase
MNDLVLCHIENGICSLILNRPEKLNALTKDLFRRLRTHVDDLYDRFDTVGCVVLRGNGGCFSAGHDLGDIDTDKKETKSLDFEAETIARLAGLPQPVIVAVEKHCYTGALELALAGDIIISTKSARFGDTHGKFALTPLWGMSQRLPRRIGMAKAKEMMFTGKILGGEEALSIGLVNICVDDKDFDATVQTFSRSVVQNSWFTNRAYKKLLEHTEDMSLNDGLRYELQNNEGYGPDYAERMAKFTRPKK